MFSTLGAGIMMIKMNCFCGIVDRRKVLSLICSCTAQKMKFSIKDFFNKYDQIRIYWRNSLNSNYIYNIYWKILIEKLIFCAVLETMPEVLIIVNIRQAACRFSTSKDLDYRLCWIKLFSSDNHSPRISVQLAY